MRRECDRVDTDTTHSHLHATSKERRDILEGENELYILQEDASIE
jgi:hypothetical protein